MYRDGAYMTRRFERGCIVPREDSIGVKKPVLFMEHCDPWQISHPEGLSRTLEGSLVARSLNGKVHKG